MIFSGARLRVARVFKDLTQRELAEKISAANSLIAAFEKGTKHPGPVVLDALCTVLEVEATYFDAVKTDEFDETEVNFRRRITATERVRRQVMARGSMFAMAVNHLRQFGRWPSFDFPNLPADSIEDVERAAETARMHWRLGIDAPIGDIARVAENAGAVMLTIEMDTAEKVDAFSRFGDVSVIVANLQKHRPSRTLFDVTHEIGHGILHQDARSMPLEIKEEQANRFAGAFLLPREAFSADYLAHRAMDWQGLLELKRYWRASIQAIIVRAYQLELMDAMEYRARFRKLSYWGWRTNEPDEPTVDEPALFKLALERARVDYGKTTADVAKDLGWSNAVFAKTTGIEIASRPESRVISFADHRKVTTG